MLDALAALSALFFLRRAHITRVRVPLMVSIPCDMALHAVSASERLL
eukprot:CAMPEP_0184396626 /NCGR_PEP_ID=MMETSP0007-20130409/53766_1 /TAXON_ID=97485 /ORGANISM="Prymnesium parvum, Strain Texoma1" /LENGTH=46 /DNA_ID= /DNA_START= /DNA_END= /DNA_ORIENTATION=